MPQSTDCWIRTLCNETKFVGYVVNSSINNNKKLLYFNFDIYWNNFNKLYADINSNIYSDISSYIKILNKIEKEFNSLLNGHNEEYLNGIQSLIQSIKDNMLENKLLEALYNYFKNYTYTKLPEAFSSILNSWKKFYDEYYNKLNSDNTNILYQEYINSLSIYTNIYI